MLADTRIIQCHAGFAVHAQRHEVMWRDGSSVQLHPVACAAHRDAPDTFLRALHIEGLRWAVFDLRRLCPEIEADVLRLLPRDVPGCVYFTLRFAFANSRAFTAAAVMNARAAWWQGGEAAAA